MGSTGRPPCRAAQPFTVASEPEAVAAGNRPVREESGWEGPGKGGEARLAGEEERGACELGPEPQRLEPGWQETRRCGLGVGAPRHGCLGSSRSPFPSPPQRQARGASLRGFVYMSSQRSLKRLGGGALGASGRPCRPIGQVDGGSLANGRRGGGAAGP